MVSPVTPSAEQTRLVPAADGVWRLASPLQAGYLQSVNAYLFEDEHGYTLVDSGVGSDDVWELFCTAMAESGLAPRHIRRVLLTHGHHDHSGLAARLASLTGAEVWIHERDLEFFNRRFIHTEQYKADLRRMLAAAGTPPAEVDALVGSTDAPARLTPEFPHAQLYRGDDVFTVGPYTLRVVWTPGHTPGHVCLCDPARAFVVCGDHILPTVSPNVAMLPDSEVNPLPTYLDSMRSFAAAAYRVALPGHGDPFDVGRRAEQLLKHQLERQVRVREILAASGPVTAYEVAERVWQHARPNSWSSFRGHVRRNAIQTIIAHLELLRDLGEAERSSAAAEPYRYALRAPAPTIGGAAEGEESEP